MDSRITDQEKAFSILFRKGQRIAFQHSTTDSLPTFLTFPFGRFIDMQFFVINPFKDDAVSRTSGGVEGRWGFTLEQDAISKDLQRRYFFEIVGTPSVRVDSGNKSIHNHVVFTTEIEREKEGKLIGLLKMCFPFADWSVFSDRAKLSRNPSATRDKGAVQKVEGFGERWSYEELVGKLTQYIEKIGAKRAPDRANKFVKEIEKGGMNALCSLIKELMKAGYGLEKEGLEYISLKEIADRFSIDLELSLKKTYEEIEEEIGKELEKYERKTDREAVWGWKREVSARMKGNWRSFYEGRGINRVRKDRDGWLRGFTPGEHSTKTGGFCFLEENGFFYSFYDGEKGFPQDYLVKYENMDSQKAWETMAGDAGIEIPHPKCRYCGVEILWEDKRPYNMDKSPHQCQKEKKEKKTTVMVRPGSLPESVDKVNQILVESKEPIFQRNGAVVRVIEAQPKKWLSRSVGSLSICAIDSTHLVDVLTRHSDWQKYDTRKEDFITIDCPKIIADTFVSRKEWSIPVLSGITAVPVWKKNGEIVVNNGYESETGLFYSAKTKIFIQDRPTKQDAKNAIQKIEEVLVGFPFLGPIDKSVAFAAILTAVIRPKLRTAPMFGFSAPKMGSGKSLLADVVSMIATGHPASVMTQAENSEEERKRITTLLMEGDSVVCIDNVERPLASSWLCAILSQETVKDRLLGLNKNIDVPTRYCTFLATGNNLTFQGDLSTRVLLCMLDPKCERPEERRFGVNLYEKIPGMRGELIAAALSILRAYVMNDCIRDEIKPFGRFEEWSDFVRCALIWADMEDPCESRKRVEEKDPIRNIVKALLKNWTEVAQDHPRTLKEITNTAVTLKSQGDDSLYEALFEIAGDKNEINQRRLGKFLSSLQGRVEDGLFIEQCGKDRKFFTLWRVMEKK